MKAVGIKHLKTHLSDYVRLAKAGETILVTDRDQVVAELGPARRRRPPLTRSEEILESLAEKGDITRASLPKKGWRWSPRGIGLPSTDVEALLDEIRSDRQGA